MFLSLGCAISKADSRGGVEDPTFEIKVKGQGLKKKKRDQGQGPTFRGQTLSRPRTGMPKGTNFLLF